MSGITMKGKTYYALFSEKGKTKWVKIGKVSYKDAKKALVDMESQNNKNDTETPASRRLICPCEPPIVTQPSQPSPNGV